jgi:hypothetical protein
MGTTISPSPRPAFALLPNANAAWPDSLSENQLSYRGLILDKDGSPTLEYSLAGLTIRESLRPGADRLDHTFVMEGAAPTQPLYCRLAAGKTIEEVSKGLFAINDRSYYVRIDPKAKPVLRQMGNQQELIMPVVVQNGGSTLRYSLEF